MENRYKLPKGIQKEYLLELEVKSGLGGDSLASILGVVGRSYRDWRREKYPISSRAVDVVEKKYGLILPFPKDEALNAWRTAKIRAARKGGFATARKYGGPGTPEGRSKGGLKAMAILRSRGLVSQPKPFFSPKVRSEDLAEFVGILLGDGHIGKEQWSITLNSVADAKYSETVFTLIERLFLFQPSLRYRTDCQVVILGGGGIFCIKYFQSLGLKIGNKVKQQVGVPEWICKDIKLSTSCLRGLLDTDGGVFVHKYKVKGKEYRYLKLNFANRSIPLLKFVYDTLKGLGFNPKLIDKVENKRVWLYNQREVDEYLRVVGTHNPRLLKHSIGGLPEW